MIKNKTYLTPSKVYSLNNGIYGFLTTYALGERSESSEAQEKGSLIHEIFYNLITEDKDFTFMPEKFRTKKECGFTIKDQEEAFLERAKQDNLLIVPNSVIPVLESLKLQFKINKFFQSLVQDYKDGKLEFEVAKEDDTNKIAGIADIVTDDLIIDIKTMSKPNIDENNFAKWSERSFATQQVIYQSLFGGKRFLFLCIQTIYPYEVRINRIEDSYIRIVKDWIVNIILPKYLKIVEYIKKQKALLNDNEPSLMFSDNLNKEKIWDLLKGLHDPSKICTAEISTWEKKALYNIIGREN